LNYEQSRGDFLNGTPRPWLSRWAAAYTRCLIAPGGRPVFVIEAVATIYCLWIRATAFAAGAVARNEGAARFGKAAFHLKPVVNRLAEQLKRSGKLFVEFAEDRGPRGSVIDLPPEVDARLAELEAEIERIDAKRHAYEPDDIARGGVFVVVAHDGDVRIERGFIRAEGEAPEPEPEEAEGGETVIDGVRVNTDGEILDNDGEDGEGDDLPEAEPEEDAGDAGKPLSDALIRDLTAHRILGLRLALGEQPDMALIAVVHTLAVQTYYRGGSTAHCLEISPTSNYLAAHADGIEDTAAAKMLNDRHAGWAADMPRDVADCASLTVNAVKLPWESSKRRAHETADKLATAVTLDMTAHWTPTVRSYFGRVTKAHIVAAVREALGDEAAEQIADKKKMEMAEAAEQLLAGTGWLPPALRTARPAWFDQQAETVALNTAEPAPSQEAHDDHFAIAAE